MQSIYSHSFQEGDPAGERSVTEPAGKRWKRINVHKFFSYGLLLCVTLLVSLWLIGRSLPRDSKLISQKTITVEEHGIPDFDDLVASLSLASGERQEAILDQLGQPFETYVEGEIRISYYRTAELRKSHTRDYFLGWLPVRTTKWSRRSSRRSSAVMFKKGEIVWTSRTEGRVSSSREEVLWRAYLHAAMQHDPHWRCVPGSKELFEHLARISLRNTRERDLREWMGGPAVRTSLSSWTYQEYRHKTPDGQEPHPLQFALENGVVVHCLNLYSDEMVRDPSVKKKLDELASTTEGGE